MNICVRWLSSILHQKDIEIQEYAVCKISIVLEERYSVKFKLGDKIVAEYCCCDHELKPDFSFVCVGSNKLQLKLN